MAAPKGHEKYGGGRQLGVPNKVSGKIKDSIVQVFRELGDIEEMVKWARKNQTAFYQMYARLAPTEIHGKGLVPLPEKKTIVDSDKEFARKVAFVLAAGVHDLENAELFQDLERSQRPN